MIKIEKQLEINITDNDLEEILSNIDTSELKDHLDIWHPNLIVFEVKNMAQESEIKEFLEYQKKKWG